MRMSINKNDPGYHERAQWRYQPYLNGKKVKDCFTADEDEGYVLRYTRDNNGQLIVDREQGKVATERLYGKVEIRRVDQCSI